MYIDEEIRELTEDNLENEGKSINFPIVFHFHQPVDNFQWVIEDCYKKAYEPLIDQMLNYPDLKFTLHFSGNLLDWFCKYKPEIVDKLKQMTKKGRIEIIGGGYYEPIYAIIPDVDKIAQMEKLNNRIIDEFGLKVNGAWLSERVWEPNYPSFLRTVGLKYVIVDDNHLKSCGLEEMDTFYSYTTEDDGNIIIVFPINEEIRYLTPWKPAYLTIEYLKKSASEKGDRVIVLLSDAEKMGVWGTTHEICYVKGHTDGDNEKPFIPTLFDSVSQKDWIKSLTLSEYIEKYNSKGLIYIPTSSYDKMEEWVLPTKQRIEFKKIKDQMDNHIIDTRIEPFMKGGFWRYYLIKYPESNTMHKKMLYVRKKLILIETKIKELNIRDSEIKKLLQKAWDEIYKSQCNDSYWHGQFGGIYLAFLRFSVFTHIINAENTISMVENLLINKFKEKSIKALSKNPRISVLDFDFDSYNDIVMESDIFNLYLKPRLGGILFELDYKPKSYNLLNVITRWYEAYHEKEEVIIDFYRKAMLRTLIFHKDTSIKEIGRNSYHELGDFISGNYEILETKIIKDIAIVKLKYSGLVLEQNSVQKIRFNIIKTIKLQCGSKKFSVSFQIQPFGKSSSSEITDKILNNTRIGIEIPFFFNGDSNQFKYTFNEAKLKNLKDDSKIGFSKVSPFREGNFFGAYDPTNDLTFSIKVLGNVENANLGKFSIKTFSRTNQGYQKIFQGLNLIVSNSFNDFSLEFSIR